MASLVDIFSDTKNNNQTNNYQDASITPVIRNLARQDMIRAFVKSNNNLMAKYDIDKNVLKSSDEITSIIENTETSVFECSKNNLEKYLESIITYILFLSDPKLSEDALMFRFIINIDVKNMFHDQDCAEMLMTELIYSSCNIKDKCQSLNKIIAEIRKKVPYILHDYSNGNSFTPTTFLNYNFPSKVYDNIHKYRERQLDYVFKHLYSKKSFDIKNNEEDFIEFSGLFKDDEDDDDSEKSIFSMSSMKSITPVFKKDKVDDVEREGEESEKSIFSMSSMKSEIPSSNEEREILLTDDEDDDEDDDEVSTHSSNVNGESKLPLNPFSEDETDILTSDDEGNSSDDEGVAQTKFRLEPFSEDEESYKSSSSSEDEEEKEESEEEKESDEEEDDDDDDKSLKSLESYSSENVVGFIKKFKGTVRKQLTDINCKGCSKNISHDKFKTPIMNKKSVEIVCFCSLKCMEKWNI